MRSDGEVRDRNFDKRTFARGVICAPRLKPKASQTWGCQSTGMHKKRTEYTFSMKCPRDRPREHGARIGPDERN